MKGTFKNKNILLIILLIIVLLVIYLFFRSSCVRKISYTPAKETQGFGVEINEGYYYVSGDGKMSFGKYVFNKFQKRSDALDYCMSKKIGFSL